MLFSARNVVTSMLLKVVYFNSNGHSLEDTMTVIVIEQVWKKDLVTVATL